MRYKWLYTGVLGALALLVLISLGEGLWGGGASSVHWTEKLFYGICHQVPERSFRFNGMPMAVNSRCFGIFAGLFTGWTLIPFIKKATVGARWPIWIFFVAVMLQIVDYSGNLFQLWENTTQTRAIAGGLLGFTGSIVVADLFQITTKK